MSAPTGTKPSRVWKEIMDEYQKKREELENYMKKRDGLDVTIQQCKLFTLYKTVFKKKIL